MTLPDFEPARRIERQDWRRTFLTLRRLLSFGWPMMGVKTLVAASNFAAMSNDEVIVVWGGGGGELDY